MRHEGTVKERDRLHCGLPNGHGREKAQKAQEGKPLSSALSPLRRTGGKILRLLSFLAAKVHDGWRIFQQEITEVIPIRNRDSLFALFAPGQISSPRRPRPGRLPDSESGSLPANCLSGKSVVHFAWLWPGALWSLRSNPQSVIPPGCRPLRAGSRNPQSLRASRRMRRWTLPTCLTPLIQS